MKENILGYDVDALSVDNFISTLFLDISTLSNSHGCTKWLACINPHSFAVSRQDSIFSQALKNADWLIPDGVGIVLASRILGGNIDERITGFDIFFGLHDRVNDKGSMSVFFLGSTNENLDLISSQMEKDFPNIIIAGTYSPPFEDEFSTIEVDKMVTAINASNADILWVGMTAPKQEKLIFDNISRLNVRFIGAIGAVFDFYIGRVKRSHPTFQRLGLEWLPRLVQQPRRLWRRTFVSAPLFLWCLFVEFLNEKIK